MQELSDTHVDSYLLSEACYLFIAQGVVKTCGTTTLLACPVVVHISGRCGVETGLDRIHKKKFIVPQLQVYLTKVFNKSDYLKQVDLDGLPTF